MAKPTPKKAATPAKGADPDPDPATTAPVEGTEPDPLEDDDDDEDEHEAVPLAGGALTDENYERTLLGMLPENERDRTGAFLFAEACITYGVDMDPAKKPLEILHGAHEPRFKFYAGDPYLTPPQPDRIRFVTAGGVKICHPIDQDFDAILRRWFRAYHQDPKSKEIVEDPLPPDLTLPREAISGLPVSKEHVFPVGYLRQRAQDAARRGTGR